MAGSKRSRPAMIRRFAIRPLERSGVFTMKVVRSVIHAFGMKGMKLAEKSSALRPQAWLGSRSNKKDMYLLKRRPGRFWLKRLYASH